MTSVCACPLISPAIFIKEISAGDLISRRRSTSGSSRDARPDFSAKWRVACGGCSGRDQILPPSDESDEELKSLERLDRRRFSDECESELVAGYGIELTDGDGFGGSST
jgi:hypothetical protein